MTFVRASEPFQEPPRRQPHGPWMIGTAVLFLFFVPLLVITAEQHPAAEPSARASTTTSAVAVAPGQPGQTPVVVPPLPPPGAPWPPPPGGPQPPTCVLGYRTGPDGVTLWTAMTTLAGRLTVTAGTGAGGPRQRLAEPEGVHPVVLTSFPPGGGTPRATLVATASGQTYDCVVGRQGQLSGPSRRPGPR